MYDYTIIDTTANILLLQKNGTVRTVLVDADDLDKLVGYNITMQGEYVQVSRYGVTSQRLARFLLNCKDPLLQVDHINLNKLDNRKKNLRLCTNAENNQNKAGAHKDSKSGIRGVSWSQQARKWRARVGDTYLGLFDSIHDAENAVIFYRSVHMPFSSDARNTT